MNIINFLISFILTSMISCFIIITSYLFLSGAAAGLYEESYYASMKAALRPSGIICCQGQPIMSCMKVKKTKNRTVSQTQYQTHSVKTPVQYAFDFRCIILN